MITPFEESFQQLTVDLKGAAEAAAS